MPSAKKWRTELCFNYTKTGKCRYGEKCAFIHDEAASLKCRGIPLKTVLKEIIEKGSSSENVQQVLNMYHNI